MVPAGCRDPERQPATPLHPCSNGRERKTASARPVDQERLARLEVAARDLRRGSVVTYNRCPGSSWVPDLRLPQGGHATSPPSRA